MQSRYRDIYETDFLLDSQKAPGGILIYYADGDEEIIHVNQYVVDLFECSSIDEFLDLVRGSFRGFVHDYDGDAAEESIWNQVEGHGGFDHLYYRIKTKTGRVIGVEDFGRLDGEHKGRPIFHVFLAEIAQGSSVDWLTGLPDMARFHILSRMAASSIEARGERPAVVALDLVGLKAFNSEYGRSEGDKLLQVFADTLRKHFGSEACSRFAEDHFYAFATESVIEQRIMGVFEDFETANSGRVLPVRAGAYVCHVGEDIVEIGTDRAKIACDLDRKTWESHLVWFNDQMRDAEKMRIHVLEHVDEAIEQGWIQPYYQAVVRAATSALCSEEALARWIDPEYGLLTPAQFVPVLEEADLLYKVDMHIVDCVLADLKMKHDQGVDLVPVSINLSQRDFNHMNVADMLSQKADEAGVPRDLLCVELTESAMSHDVELFTTQIELLHQAGFEVWMDDFGSGYSSLNLLQEFDFDVIKLDMGFMSSIASNAKAHEVVKGVLRAAGQLGVKTLAEGIETEQQAIILESLGCNMLQGYYFARPNSLKAVIDLFVSGEGRTRELLDEAKYWDTIGMLDLVEPTTNLDGQGIGDGVLDEYPVGVLERRDGVWFMLRSNRSFREFLESSGIVPKDGSLLLANRLVNSMDADFDGAISRCSASGEWEVIAGHLEDGAGFRFYVRSVASTERSESFLFVATPTLLGLSLGVYGDVPVAYAVFRAVFEEGSDQVIDAEYVYANPMYCETIGHERDDLIGHSFSGSVSGATSMWFSYCYRATVLGESVHDVVFSPEVGHWLSFNIEPSPVTGCFVYAFSVVDDEQREREQLEWAGTHDSLTGLLNRRGIDLTVNQFLEGNPDAPYALALMDIDDFKVTNDLYGHKVGDEALMVLARAVKRFFTKDVILGRNGGDELFIMLHGDEVSRAEELFAEFTSIDHSFEYEGASIPMTASLGYAVFPDDVDSLANAYTKADAALYSVKLDGKEGCKRYSPHLQAQYRSQLGFTPRDIAENVPGAIMVHRAGGDGEILFANDELVEMFDCDSLADFMEYVGGAFRGVVHPEDGVRVYEELVSQVSLDDVGAKGYVNYRILTKKGATKHVESNGRLVEIDAIGKVFYVLMFDADERSGAKGSRK